MLKRWFDNLGQLPLKRGLSLLFMLCFFTAARAAEPVAGHTVEAFKFFAPFRSAEFGTFERVCLLVVLGIALAGLGYALMLVKQVKAADQEGDGAAVFEGGHVTLGGEVENGSDHDDQGTDLAELGRQISLGALTDGSGDLLHLGGALVGGLDLLDQHQGVTETCEGNAQHDEQTDALEGAEFRAAEGGEELEGLNGMTLDRLRGVRRGEEAEHEKQG